MPPRPAAVPQPPPRRRVATNPPPGFVVEESARLPAVLAEVDAPDPEPDPDDEPAPAPPPAAVALAPATPEEDELAAMRRQIAALQAERDALAAKLAEPAPAGAKRRAAKSLNELARRVRVYLRLRDQVDEIRDDDELANPGEAEQRKVASGLFARMAERGAEIWQREMDARERAGQPSKMVEPLGVRRVDERLQLADPAGKG